MNKRRRYKAKARRYLQSRRMWNRFKAGLHAKAPLPNWLLGPW